jgi:sulfur carrier protein
MADTASPSSQSSLADASRVDIELNGAPHRIESGCSVQQLVDSLGLSQQALAVAVNREVVPRQGWAHRALQAQDCVDVVRPIGGG